ncbi:winged helix-turn-helix domain-containing protein [Cyclobacterium sp. 1_MG-2023]|uniref:winged helix-turn-helix domain-containing protein n=1 Tax=Cyclobacterium sp. 1_MG-2023 TaxID=3062681 RepID=UPI0026E2FA5E|nr:winged helix-turn-helix domain-containing protein [Cyclobacterium sp. 1_MG-2023]MDO6437089.1 winged helix-turn-helix domain-containing protein [Cyclobacterium sp. 1_MG-2023]
MKKLIQPAGIGMITMLFTMVLLWPWKSDDFAENKEIRLRNVGHQILLASGDSTSRVLPIRRISKNEFILVFENPFQFDPDSLVNVIHKGLGEGLVNKAEDKYQVNVMECMANQIVYSYQMSSNKDKTLIPCKGRVQPKDCYSIKIRFNQNSFRASNFSVPIIFGVLAFGFIFLFKNKTIKLNRSKSKSNRQSVGIGKFELYHSKQLLKIGNEEIQLSQKENKLLTLFASHQNEMLERDHLLKEIWEDEGVFVGRSLDMFVSKLRKKLIQDPNIQIKNIRGKGYILQVK